MKQSFKATVLCVIFWLGAFSSYAIKPEIIESTRKAIVSIDVRISLSAYDKTGVFAGTGFVNNLAKGLIVTNKHVVGGANIGQYFVTFANGQKVEAKVKYYDECYDFAILQVDPKAIPKEVSQITFSDKSPALNQSVFIVGNNEGQSFSFHDGRISNLYNVTKAQQNYVVSLNVAGGSSGSPAVNEDGEAIGLHFGGSKTYGLSLKGDYVKNALAALAQNTLPPRKTMGALCSMYSLDDAVMHRSFPADLVAKYLKDFPDAMNKVLQIRSTIPSTPAASKLQSGDIVWEVNGKAVGPSLYNLDREIDNSKDNKIELAIYRAGKKLLINVDLYDLRDYQITKLVEFGGAVLFHSDHLNSFLTGMPLKSLAVADIKQGMSMSNIPIFYVNYENVKNYRLRITAIGNNPVHDLDSFISAIDKLNGSKYTNIDFQNYQMYYIGWNTFMNSDHELLKADITLDETDFKPRIFNLNPVTLEWELQSEKSQSEKSQSEKSQNEESIVN